MAPLRVGILVGREKSFPDALIAEINRRQAGVEASYAQLEATRHDQPPPYEVLVDRISHDVTCYQPALKLAALNGSYVVNDPFWRIADDKFFGTALAAKLGIAVPKTAVLPSKRYGPDVNEGSLRNLRFVDWEKLLSELGLPVFIKPHWGGGWRDVTRCTSLEELWRAYDKSGTQTMIVQESITWTQYVRCLVIGQEHVRPALWNPALGHFERYGRAAETMPALDAALEKKVIDQALLLNRALGYDMNTVEFAIRDGVPYAIDFMNSAPDFDISSLGPDHFKWVVERMAELCISAAEGKRPRRAQHWDTALAR